MNVANIRTARSLAHLRSIAAHTQAYRSVPQRNKSTHTPPTSSGSDSVPPLRKHHPLAPGLRRIPTPQTVAAQPPPTHGAPRLIRHPPASEGPPTSSSALYGYTRRGPASRLFSFRNSASASSANAESTAIVTSNTTFALHRKISHGTDIDTMTANASSSIRKRASAKSQNGVDASHDHSSHDHSHGIFGHSHAGHSHGAEGSAEEADRLIEALKGKGDRGSNITVVGLIANLILCGAKGVAGVYLHSAALLADAAHSLSDTFSDLVTLFCWKMSQRPASQTHPLGYGKFETMGGLGVSVVLVAGAFAIGMHSYSLLLDVLQPHLSSMPSGLQAFGTLTSDLARAAGNLLHHDHHGGAGHAGGDAAGAVLEAARGVTKGATETGATENLLDPNAMWFALISVIVKEWLYHATLKIAREEKSSVLEANAIHHRSDSLSSGVTFLAIGGSYLGFPVLDPLGGLLVAGLIGKQGIELLINALADLSDRGVQPEVLGDFERALQDIVDQVEVELDDAVGPAAAAGRRTRTGAGKAEEAESTTKLLGWKDLRAVRSGVSTFVDVTLILDENVQLKDARQVEANVREKLVSATKGVKEVRIHLDTE